MFIDEVKEASEKSNETQEKFTAAIKEQILGHAQHANTSRSLEYSLWDFMLLAQKILCADKPDPFKINSLMYNSLTSLEKEGFKLTPMFGYGPELKVKKKKKKE